MFEELLPDQGTRTLLVVGFALVIVAFLALDLGVLRRRDRKVSLKSAALQTAFWVSVSLAFAVLIHRFLDEDLALTWVLAYVTEWSLSVDNLVVWLIILQYFGIRQRYYHKVLIWGVLGAILFRALFIFFGFFLIERFEWILYVFGAILIGSAIQILAGGDKEYDPSDSRVYRFLSRRLRFVAGQGEGRFVVREDGKRQLTTLFLTLLMIETTDIVFAIDSIPAVFSISQDRFVVYTSNVFAVLGLRAMFFLLSGVIDRFRFLDTGVAIVLLFIGLKMFASIADVHVPPAWSLGIVLAILGGSIVLSLLLPAEDDDRAGRDGGGSDDD